MSTQKQADRKVPSKEAAKGVRRTKPRKPPRAVAMDKMIRGFEKRLKKDEPKLTVAEYIRLVQLREEIQDEEPKEIKVTWVEPAEKESVTAT